MSSATIVTLMETMAELPRARRKLFPGAKTAR